MSEETVIMPEGVHKAIAEAFPDAVVGVHFLADGQQITEVKPDGLFQVVGHIKETHPILSCLSAYDDNGLGVFYSFITMTDAEEAFSEVCLRVLLAKPEGAGDDWMPEVQSLCDLMPAANWHEREMFDLYGIKFTGHPDLRRIFLPEDWHGYPGRRDYKEPEQFVAMRDGEDVTLQTQEEGSW